MAKLGKTKISKEKVYAAKKHLKIWDVNVGNIFISNSVKAKTNSKHFIGYLDKDIRPLVLIIPKIGGDVKIFKVGDKNSKLMSFCIDDEKLLEKYEVI